MSEDLRNHVCVPIALYERMAEAYYGRGPSLPERREEIRATMEEASAKQALVPAPVPERLDIETASTKPWKPMGVAARPPKPTVGEPPRSVAP